jgi:DHA1 family bicyclomycin/chloramphenicol resistance-like MFS transporter
MAPHGSVAGSASALLGTVQFLLGGVAGGLFGVLANGRAVPLAGVVAGCGIAAVLTYKLVNDRAPAVAPEPAPAPSE